MAVKSSVSSLAFQRLPRTRPGAKPRFTCPGDRGQPKAAMAGLSQNDRRWYILTRVVGILWRERRNMGQEWYVETSSGKAGPFASAALRQLAQTGKIAPESLVSLDGKNWSPASRVKGLVFADTPPVRPSPKPQPTVDPPTTKTPPDDSDAVALPYKSTGGADPAPRRLSTAAILPAQFFAGFFGGALAASATSMMVKLARMVGLVELNTTATSLAARVGLPAIAFVGVFALIFWRVGREVSSAEINVDMSNKETGDALAQITADMSDEQIGDALAQITPNMDDEEIRDVIRRL